MTSHLDQAFLIDVSEEDDSLLPAGNKAKHRNAGDQQQFSSVLPGHTECIAEAADAIKKDDLLYQQVSDGIPEESGKLALPVMTEEPVPAKKKKAGFNVRKSLAWNNAFFTEEGVLDSEELSLVNTSFQKPLGLPKPSTFKKPMQALKPLKPPMMPKINLTSHKVALTAECKENQIVSAVISPSSSTGSLIESLPKSSEQHTNSIKGPNRIMQGVITPISLANVQMDTSKKEKALADSSESTLLVRRSLDKGSSLPGMNCCNGEDHLFVVETDPSMRAAMASSSVTKEATNLKQIAKDGRGTSPSVNKEAMRQSALVKLTGHCISLTTAPQAQPAPSSIKFISETASTKTQHTTKKLESGNFAGRDKPSGLRMPSPKLGFFDTSRTASQVALPHERTGHGYGVTGLGKSNKDVEIGNSRYSSNQIQGLKHPATSTKPSHQLLQASRKQTIETRSSSGIPSAPHVHGHSAGVASMRGAPVHELSRSVSYPSNRVNRKIDTTEQVLQARKNGQNRSTRGKPVRSQPGNSTVRNVPGQENLSPDCKDDKGMLQKRVVAQSLALGNPNIRTSGNICAIGAVQKLQEIVQNVVEPSEESVSQRLSSTSNSLLGQGNNEPMEESVSQLLSSTSNSLLGQGNVEPMEEVVVVSRNQNCGDTGGACISQNREEWRGAKLPTQQSIS